MAAESLTARATEFKSGQEEQVILEWLTASYLATELRGVLEHSRFSPQSKLTWYSECRALLKLLEGCRKPGREGVDDLGEEIVITMRQRRA